MIKSNLFLLFFGLFTIVNAQVSESCDCTVDTTGYANYITTLNIDENASFNFNINGTFAVAFGVIDGNTPSKVQNLIDNYPNVTTIVMHSVPGSMNDDANLQASQLIYNHGYKMYLPLGGFVASGGTDMILAGSIRVIEVTPNSVGVHSWAADENGNVTATDFPVGHANHQPYIDYYMTIGFSQTDAEAFYYFTINSAPFNGVHWMTEAELDQYKVRSCRYSEDPSYSVSVHGDFLMADLENKTYQWIDCGTNQPISGETNITFTPSSNGEYAVIVTETGCQDTSACFSFSTLSLEEDTQENSVYIVNNPTLNEFDVYLGILTKEFVVRLYNMSGQLMESKTFSNVDQFKMNKPKMPGVYTLELISNTTSKSIKWVNQ